MRRVEACFGPANLWNKDEETLEIMRADAGYQEIVLHEYGHAVMQKASYKRIEVMGCNPHGPKRMTSPSCAWVEGWADFFVLYVRYPPSTPDPEFFKSIDAEDYSSPITGANGYLDEGRVMAGLWDLYDTHNDDDTLPEYGQPDYSDQNKSSPVSMSTMLEAMDGADVQGPEASVRAYIKRLLKCGYGVTCEPVNASTTLDIANLNWLMKPATSNR